MPDILMEYAKLDNGSLKRLRKVPHVSNPTAKTLAAYAAAHGYKAIQNTPSPGRYHTVSYTDAGEAIAEVWIPLDMEVVRSQATDEVQQKLNEALSRRTSIPCSLGFPIIYDQDALINAVGMRAAGYCATFIDANNITHTLNETEVQSVVSTLETYRTALYATSQQARVAIQQAETAADVEAVISNLSL